VVAGAEEWVGVIAEEWVGVVDAVMRCCCGSSEHSVVDDTGGGAACDYSGLDFTSRLNMSPSVEQLEMIGCIEQLVGALMAHKTHVETHQQEEEEQEQEQEQCRGAAITDSPPSSGCPHRGDV
jgi:hypothetical protein